MIRPLQDNDYPGLVRGGERFVRARGFEPGRIERISAVDPRTVDLSEFSVREARARDAGYRLASFRDVDPHRLHRLEMEAADDVPDGEPPHEISFDEWRSEIAEQPNLDWDASSVVLLGDESVSESLLTVDLEGRRARNEGTGTARAHRRRGLATLAKLATTRWALEHGIQTIVTDNAEENTAMLAIDERLGYRPIVERRRWAKELVSK